MSGKAGNAIDDAEKILVVVNRLIRTHTDTLL